MMANHVAAAGRESGRTVLSNGPTTETVDALRDRVDLRLARLVPRAPAGRAVAEAARYALLAPGKRIRPLLALFAAMDRGAPAERALDAGCAVEMVHAASLVLDDLPSMDNARRRRGRPATHLAFGESTAILASVALLNQAFATIARCEALPAPTRVRLVGRLSEAIGFDGLVAGQEDDLGGRAERLTIARLETLNRRKTSVLFEAALEMGAAVAGAPEADIESLRAVAANLGLAYQIADDLIDCAVSGSPALKDVGQDAGKTTVVSLLGIGGARERAAWHLVEALRLLPAVSGGEAALRTYIQDAFSRTCA